MFIVLAKYGYNNNTTKHPFYFFKALVKQASVALIQHSTQFGRLR
jgi:hypothetical protein